MLITVVDDLVDYVKDNIKDTDDSPCSLKDESYIGFSYWLHKKAGTFTETEIPYELFKRLMFVKVDDGKYFYRFPGDLYHFVIQLLKRQSDAHSQNTQEESLNSEV